MNYPRGAFMAQISRKRKEREDFFLQTFKSNIDLPVRGKQVQPHIPQPNTTSSKPKPGAPVCSNRLLAGYMAHEFLTKGTLLGQKFDPARAQAVPLTASCAEPKKPSPQPPTKKNCGPAAESSAGAPTATELKMRSYAEVASLLKTEGAHIPGIVNPSQLARWIQM